MRSSTPSYVMALATLVSHVNAHGYLSQPKASYKPNTIYTTYNGLTGPSINKAFAGGVFNHEPVNNAKQFTKYWNATGYKSLREMIDPISPGYGFSLDTAKPVDVSSYKEMWWQNDELKEGFLKSHYGPCEGWIDGHKAFHHDDCNTKFPTYPAKIPTKFSICKKKKCLFVFYWLALHSEKWQIYKQCVPITLGGMSEVGGEASTTVPTVQDDVSAAKETPATPTTDAAQNPSPAMSYGKQGTGASGCKPRVRS